MKFYLSHLEQLISLPTKDPLKLRHILDDLGLEVESYTAENNDYIYNIETLAHRGDHQAVLGIAREFCGRYNQELKIPEVADNLPKLETQSKIFIESEKCFSYSLLELELEKEFPLEKNISKYLEEPTSERHSLIHISNYLLKEIGQPTHTFDKDKIEGDIFISETDKEEEIEALDGKTYKIPKGSLVIRDSKKIIAVAGVIGCANSMLTLESKTALVESANFCPISVRKTARAMGLSTDASYIFERGADPENVDFALKRMIFLAGTKVRVIDYRTVKKQEKPLEIKININWIRLQTQLQNLQEKEIVEKLKYLGFQIKSADKEELIVEVPSWRKWNVKTPATVLEDFVRARGYNSVHLEIPKLSLEKVPNNPNEDLIEKIEPALIGSGFIEVITRSYYANSDIELLAYLSKDEADKHIKIVNSLDGAYSNLKITNLIHFAKLAERNSRLGIETIKVFEIGRLFKQTGYPDSLYSYEQDFLTLGVSGRWYENLWQKSPKTEELIKHFKGSILGICNSLKILPNFRKGTLAWLHPGQQADIVYNNETIGSFGVIHPYLKEKLDLSSDFLYCELELPKLAKYSQGITVPELVDFPVVKRDLTLKVPVGFYSAEVLEFFNLIKVKNLKLAEIVDSFSKKEEDFVRVSYRLFFQDKNKTLEGKDVEAEIEKILQNLKSKYNIELVA